MKASVHWLGATALAGLVAWGGLPPAASAQFMPAPGLGIGTGLPTVTLGRPLGGLPAFGFNPFTSPTLSALGGAGFNPTLSANPYAASAAAADPYSSLYPYAGGASTYGESPVAGFLRGTSDVIRAQGEYGKDVQKARILQTQADEGRLNYRRQLIEQFRYERMSQPTAEEVRQQQLAGELSRARHEPPISDIVSARSLNDLLHHLTSESSRKMGEKIPVDDDVLKHINVTGVNPNGASVGLLKDEGKLSWPQSLMSAEFQAPRELLSKTLRNVVGNLKSGESVGTGSLNDLKTALAQLNLLVSKSELSATEYIEAKSYLDQVSGAVRALGDKDVANYFNYKFNAKNVAELVDDMRTKGLDFAPAAPGDEGAYRALQQALAAYDYSITPSQPAKSPEAKAPELNRPELKEPEAKAKRPY